MTKETDPPKDFSELRRIAEAEFGKRHAQEDPVVDDVDFKQLIHELQVHQIELEMQNEELQQARNEAEGWLKRYTDLYDFAPVGYFSLNQNGVINQVNLTGALLLGVERVRLVGRPFGLFVIEADRTSFNAFLEYVFNTPVTQTCEMTLQKEGAGTFWVEIQAVLADREQECHIAVMDIQDRKIVEMKLQQFSMHDPLTGLFNRSYFEESMGRLAYSRHFPISILMADVDQLKIINDRLGHAAGDTLLKRVAEVLKIAFRSEDVVARIGGDEFAVLLPNTSVDAATVTMLRLKEILKEHNANYFTENSLHLSIGVSTANFGDSLIEILKEADEAMYHQKRA